MDDERRCTICNKIFSQKSSLVRHSKKCVRGPTPSLRQKSCRSCTTSKTKCDLVRPRCTRCEQRDLPCEYVLPMTKGNQNDFEYGSALGQETDALNQAATTIDDLLSMTSLAPFESTMMPMINVDMNMSPDTTFDTSDLYIPVSSSTAPDMNDIQSFLDTFTDIPHHPKSHSSGSMSPLLLASGLELGYRTASPNAPQHPTSDTVSKRPWMPMWKATGKTCPPLVRHSMETFMRYLQTWPRMLSRGIQTPPIFHHTHITPANILPPITRCIEIARFWSSKTDPDAAQRAITHEINTILSCYQTLDERNLLPTLQALLLYTIMIMFPSNTQQTITLIDPDIFFGLHKAIKDIARTGLVIPEEWTHELPNWISWVHVTTKRRVLTALYLLHWTYAQHHGLNSFECRELGFLPGPPPKYLWEEVNEERWAALYRVWLEQWERRPFTMRDFAEIKAGLGLDERTALWLEGADELGLMLFSIVSASNREKTLVHDWDMEECLDV